MIISIYNAQKEVVKNTFEERCINGEPHLCFLLMEEFKYVCALNVDVTRKELRDEFESFVNYQSPQSEILNDTFLFSSLKSNLKSGRSIHLKLIHDLKHLYTFCSSDDETIPAVIGYIQRCVDGLFNKQTHSLIMTYEEAELVVNEIKLTLEKLFSRLKDMKCSDKFLIHELDAALTKLLDLCLRDDICKSLVVLVFDMRISNMQKLLEEFKLPGSEVSRAGYALIVCKLQRIRRMLIFNTITSEELSNEMSKLKICSDLNLLNDIIIDKAYSFICLVSLSRFKRSVAKPDASYSEMYTEFKELLERIIKRIDQRAVPTIQNKWVELCELYRIGRDEAFERDDLEFALLYSRQCCEASSQIYKFAPLPKYSELYLKDIDIKENIEKRIKQKIRNQTIITYGSIFVGVIGVASVVSYLLFRSDKKE